MTRSKQMAVLHVGFFVGWILWPLLTMAQVTCFNFGVITDCASANGQSYTQVPTGPSGGVIITDRDTQPYTIITPAQPNARAFDPTPLPQGYEPSYHSTPSTVYGTGPVIVPGMEPYSYGR